MKLYNTLTRQVDEFTPLSPEKVTLYTCGPTVYNKPHIGNWSAFIHWDTLVRVLLMNGYKVERTLNITDVGHLVSDADDGEDKLEKGARREGKTAWEIADTYTNDFLTGMKALNLLPAEHTVRATNRIPEQLDLLRTLYEKGYAYQTHDGIYFDTSKFKSYADFAQLDLMTQKAGARVDQNAEKRQPWDFALWKFTPPGKVRDMEWETPADLLDLPPREGEVIMGFPGWHLECSAIILATLGETIDLHTGGIDHIPVHHTNEIAQSEAATGQKLANYWLHCNHIKIDGGKISKSLGNSYTLDDLEERGFSPLDLRMFILQGQYSNEGNFSFENLQAARNRLRHWHDIACLRHQIYDGAHKDIDNNDRKHHLSPQATIGAIREALNDNLNTPLALSIADEAFSQLENKPLRTIYRAGFVNLLEFIDETLGLKLMESTPDISDKCKRLIIERRHARDNKDWKTSDQLRDKLRDEFGVLVRDSANGTIWSYDK